VATHLHPDVDAALEALDLRLRAILPEEYQDAYEKVEPVPMRSAGLKFDGDGRVAWNDMWESFCDLAMAGGPPHKGSLLEPASAEMIAAEPDRYEAVVREICRGITLATGLDAHRSLTAGWVRVRCHSGVMAGWLLRAITMENVSARADVIGVELPAGPGYRLEKEIKNVVTVIAKTSHYWIGHMSRGQHGGIARIFAALAKESPLVVPAREGEIDAALAMRIGQDIHQQTGLIASERRYAGWLGLECPDVRSAVWMMRALVVSNVLARREGTVLFVPVNPAIDPDGARVVAAVASVHRLAQARGALRS